MDLALSGDITIFLNDGEKLHVSSAVLKQATTVFIAMFGPHFLEGQNLSEAAPKEVALPDDNPQAVTLLFSAIHHKCNIIKIPEFETLGELAQLVDKYQCAFALTAAGHYRLIYYAKIAESEKCHGWRNLLWIAYLFDNPDAFKEISRGLILHWTTSFTEIGETAFHIP